MASNEVEIKDALENPDTSATLLHAIVRRRYGEDWYLWDPVTVELELRDDYGAEIPAENMDKLCAIQVLITSDAFFRNHEAFMAICSTFSEGNPLFNVMDDVSVEELAWGVTEAAINRELLTFSPRIKRSTRELLAQDGYAAADYPDALKELLEYDPESVDVLHGIASIANKTNADAYVKEQLADLISQFNRIQSLQGLDDQILTHGFMTAVVRGR